MAKVNLLGVNVDKIFQKDLINEICEKIEKRDRFLVSHVNITALNLAYQNQWLKEFFNRCDRVYCDGMGVMLGARMLGEQLPERFTLADWVWPLAECLSKEKFSMFLLGSKPGVAENAARKLQERIPGSRIFGTMHGYFERGKAGSRNETVLEMINAVDPDLLLVGLGMPTQEKWMKDNWSSLNVRVGITCGALFEYLAGDLRRGPVWMTENYLEWLARMLISPSRYTGRYLRDIPLFLYRVLQQRAGKRNDE